MLCVLKDFEYQMPYLILVDCDCAAVDCAAVECNAVECAAVDN